MAVPAGNFAALSLGPLHTGPGSHLPLNLGVDWNTDPPDPPDPPIRGLRLSVGVPWAVAPRVRRALRAAWGQSPKIDVTFGLAWGQAPGCRRGLALAWGQAPSVDRAFTASWRTELPQLRAHDALPWRSLPTTARDTGMAWRSQSLAHKDATCGWLHLPLTSRGWQAPFLTQLAPARATRAMPWQVSNRYRDDWRIPWGPGRRAPWIVRPPKPPKPPVDPESPFPPGRYVALLLGCPTTTLRGVAPLNLGVTACHAARPSQRTYIVRNSLSVARLPDRLPIEVDAVTISTSADAWCNSVDMTLSRPADLPELTPNAFGPRAVEITINGYVWTAIIESYNRSRQVDGSGRPAFGIQVSGRSRTALLAGPYAPARTKVTSLEKSAAQLVDEELADTGFTADYGAVDWLVPPGAWYYDSLAPLDAIARIAEASGAVVQSDPEEAQLRIVPRYPTSPWDWTTTSPDHIVQDDVITADSLQVRSAPLYDAVVVTGEIVGKGVTAVIKRSGEAGTLYAPQASSPLINVDAVAGERGRNILSDRGEQAAIDMTLPLFPSPLGTGQTGRVLPLELVRVVEGEGIWHGLCGATRISASRDGGALVVEQTISVERHYTDAD